MFKDKKKIISTVLCVAVLITTLVVSYHLLSNYKVITVTGISMEDTYISGEILLCKKEKIENIKYKDIIVFSKENGDGSLFIKRVIAVGNEKVKIENNKVYIDGEQLEEEYIKEDMSTPDMEEQDVPYMQLFVLGDNRNMSDDSRGSTIGFVNKDELVGKIVLNLSDYKISKVMIIIVMVSLIAMLYIVACTIKDDSTDET